MRWLRHWHQDLNDSKKKALHFRGAFYKRASHSRLFGYEICSGPALSLKLIHGNHDECETMLSLGLVLFTAYLTFRLPNRFYFKRKCIATWDNNKEFYLIDGREYGFYFYEWSFVWNWHNRPMESSSSDPKWMRFRFDILDFLFGRTEYMANEVASTENVKFKIGAKEFVLNEVKWERRRWFRRYIPIALYCKEDFGVDIKIDTPPMRAGKGENSWDCDDDGSFGISGPWKHEKPSWHRMNEMKAQVVEYYCKHVLEDAKRYGSGSGERGISANDQFQYTAPVAPEFGPANGEVKP